MKELKEIAIKVFRAEPYTKERYNLIKEMEKIENELNVYLYASKINQENKTIQIDILKREKGLYKTIETFTINNIEVE